MNKSNYSKILILSISVGLFSYAIVYIISIANALDLGKLIPFVDLSGINLNGAPLNLVDNSNEQAAELSTHELIERAGFEYEIYYALADDGYMTQLIRIVNPLADASHLKSPPVMLQHGQTANSRNFVMQSNSQTHPMPWPRGSESRPSTETANDEDGDDEDDAEKEESDKKSNKLIPDVFEFVGDVLNGNNDESESGGGGKGDKSNQNRHKSRDSSNRSLAFMLANNGYDVWLSSTRGVDENNRGFFENVVAQSLAGQKTRSKNMTRGEEQLLVRRIKRSYWSFTLDDQIAHEMPSQINTVLNVTGSDKITLFGYSNTALTTFAMLSIRKDIAKHVDTYVAIAPVVYYSKLGGWFKWLMEDFMQLIPKTLDAELFMSDRMAWFVRRATARACSNLSVRYSMCKWAIDMLFGSSSQFRTNLELPFFYHIMRPTSWKCLAQHLQIVKSHRLAKFDYGPRKNKRYYGTKRPPEYDLSQVDGHIQLALVSGENDCWANKATVEKVRRKLGRKLALDIVVPDYNHADLTAAFDVDVKVNLPLLKFLDSRYAQLLAAREALKSKGEVAMPSGEASASEL